jgi:hypothetical protein
MPRLPGSGAIVTGAALVLLGGLYLAAVTECASLLGCLPGVPASFRGSSATFLALLVPLVGVMLLVLGGFLRARARLPRRIV